jgi:hypothetical protein
MRKLSGIDRAVSGAAVLRRPKKTKHALSLSRLFFAGRGYFGNMTVECSQDKKPFCESAE